MTQRGWGDKKGTMPRLARLDAPGVFHHIIIRGIERRKIFRDNHDRENLLERLGKLVLETKTGCYVWAFLPNHVHKKTPWIPASLLAG